MTEISIGEKEKWTNKGTDKQYVTVFCKTIQLITIKLCAKFQNPYPSRCWEIFDGKTLKDRQTNIITEKAKTIYPLYFSYRGYNDVCYLFFIFCWFQRNTPWTFLCRLRSNCCKHCKCVYLTIYSYFCSKTSSYVSTLFSIKTNKEGNDQESIQTSSTAEPGHTIRKWQKHNKTSHTREPKGQPFLNWWPLGCKKHTWQYGRHKHK